MSDTKMQELIAITKNSINGELVDTVDARTLWEKLEVKTDFSHWIKRRLETSQLVDNQDFTSVVNFDAREIGATKRIEYKLTLDAAKHIAMMEGTEQGKKIRQYFINVEKAARAHILPVIEYANHPNVLAAQKHLQQTIEYVKVQEEQQRQLQMIIEQHRIQQEQQKKLAEIEAKTDALVGQSEYFSVLGFAKLKGYKLPFELAISIGKYATKLSNSKGISIGKITDPRFGQVNTYHVTILTDIFDSFKQQQ